MVCKLFIMTCQTSINLLDNLHHFSATFMQKFWGSRFEPTDSPNRTCWTGPSRSSPRFSSLLEPNRRSSPGFGQSAFWTGPNRTAASLLPNDESRMSSMYIPLCVVDSREYRCSYGGRLGGYGNPNEVSKRNDMDNGWYKYLEWGFCGAITSVDSCWNRGRSESE